MVDIFCSKIFNNSERIIIGIVQLFFTIITIMFSISSCIAAVNYWHTTCDKNAFMAVPLWLVLNAITSLLLCLIIPISLYIINVKQIKKLVVLLFFLELIPIICFAITGTIILNQISPCYKLAHSLYDSVLMTIVMYWFIIAFGGIPGVCYVSTIYFCPEEDINKPLLQNRNPV